MSLPKCEHVSVPRSWLESAEKEISKYWSGPLTELAMHLRGFLATPQATLPPAVSPVDMLLWCPKCAAQHVDAPEPEKGWTNPPHATHTCKRCGLNWRPSNALTNGVQSLPSHELKHIERMAAADPGVYHPAPAAASGDTPETDAAWIEACEAGGDSADPTILRERMEQLERKLAGMTTDRDMWLKDSAKQNHSLGRVIAERDVAERELAEERSEREDLTVALQAAGARDFSVSATDATEGQLVEAMRPAVAQIFDHFDELSRGQALQLLVDSLRDIGAPAGGGGHGG